MAIDTASNLVSELQRVRQALVQLVTSPTLNQDQVDAFAEALDPAFLNKNIGSVNTALVDEGPSEAQLLGALEENAFLAMFQNCHTRSKRSRCSKWAGIHSVLNADSSAEGPMESQLKLVGAAVDHEFLTKVLKIVQPTSLEGTQFAVLNPDGTVSPAITPNPNL
jgi:hypothetical protein